MIRFSRSIQYAIRAMIDVATVADGGVAITYEVAERQDIPQAFLTKIIQRLVQAGLLRAYRGAAGGIALSQPAAEINLRQIVEAMEGPIFLNYCLVRSGECPRQNTCAIHEVWVEAQQELLRILEGSILANLAARERELSAEQAV